jgi:hypothetical protein
VKLSSLEFRARYLWPIQKVFASGLAERCKRCLLSSRQTTLENGLCEPCRTFVPSQNHQTTASPELEKAFEETLRQHIGRGRRHDALVLLSGGKDSAFILHKLRTDYADLRILCLLVDNGFLSPVAATNAAHAAARLQCDFLIVRSWIPEFARVFREAFLNLQGRWANAVVDFADGRLIYEIGKTTAAEMDIPLLVGGMSWVQLQQIVGIDTFEMPDQTGPRMIFPLAVWRVDEQDIRKTVREERLLTPGNDSPLVTNSDLVLPMFVIDIINHGYVSFETEFAQLVREKKTDRHLWLNIFQLMEHGVRNGQMIAEANRTLSRLGLTVDQITRGSS